MQIHRDRFGDGPYPSIVTKYSLNCNTLDMSHSGECGGGSRDAGGGGACSAPTPLPLILRVEAPRKDREGAHVIKQHIGNKLAVNYIQLGVK